MTVRSGRGDKGFTDLHFKERISKDSHYTCAIGDLDELTSFIGLVTVKIRSKKDRIILEKIQHSISQIASEITIGSVNKKKLGILLIKEDADWIKTIIYRLERKVKLERCFYLPGGTEISAFLDIARAISRRAERNIVALFRKEKLKNENILAYMNCISDVLFIMARKRVRKRDASMNKRKKK